MKAKKVTKKNGVKTVVSRTREGSTVETDCSCQGHLNRVHSDGRCPNYIRHHKLPETCTPVWGSCSLPNGHKGPHNANAVCTCSFLPSGGMDPDDHCPCHAPQKPARATKKAKPDQEYPLSIEWKEHGRWKRSENTFLTVQQAKEHAETIGVTKYRIVKSFPARIVVGQGFPWANGLGKKRCPYDSIKLNKGRMGASPKSLNFPKALWSNSVPQYRLVLERIK